MAWQQWSSVSHGIADPGTSVTAVQAGTGRFALFVLGIGGEVFTTIGNVAQGWAPWSTVSQGRAGQGTSVAAVPIGAGHFALFAADPAGGVYTASGGGTKWSIWTSVSEGHAGPGTSVTAVPIGDRRIALFLADPNGGVYTASGSGTKWSGWTSVSEGHAGPGTSVTAVPIGDGRIALFAADPAGGVYTASGSGTIWSIWTSVAEGQAAPGTSVTAVSLLPSKQIAVFVSDREGGVFTTQQVGAKWIGWSSVSEGNAGPRTSVTALPIGMRQCVVFVADRGGGIFATAGDPVLADFNHPIKHVFVLMLENRSFDHLLGFSKITGTDATKGTPTTIEGLTERETNSAGSMTFKVETGAADRMETGPGHDFLDVLEQLCGPLNAFYPPGGPYPTPIDNSGFVVNYARRVGINSARDVMKCFAREDLPVLNALAREFVVCDHWFCSMPGPTEPNRYFMHAGTSGTFDDSPTKPEIVEAVGSPGGGFRFNNRNVFERLNGAGVSWRIYAGDHLPVAAELPKISPVHLNPLSEPDIRELEEFANDINDDDFDARFIHIEPSYDAIFGDFAGGNSQHPKGSVAAGERLIKFVYEAIRSSPVWEKSLLIITWDEHGGYYDHVAPPAAAKSGANGRKHGFVFDQLGPRVPAVIVSPLIPKNLIEKKTFDHTAIGATLRRIFKLAPFDNRDGISGGVDHLVRLQQPRNDTPAKLPNAKTPASISALLPPNPNQSLTSVEQGLLWSTIHSAAVQWVQIEPERRAEIQARIEQLKTRGDAEAFLKDAGSVIRAKR